MKATIKQKWKQKNNFLINDMNMKGIYTSILSADFAELKSQINTVEAEGAAGIHCDIMDGHFVPNITFGPMIVDAVNRITELPLDVHLMIDNPQNFIQDFIKAGADYISVHYENNMHLNRVINLIKDCGAKAGVAINPATPVFNLSDIISNLDYVLIMTVNPGFGGQHIIRSCFKKISQLKKLIKDTDSDCMIEVDGGVDSTNIKELKELGADMIVAGASLFKSNDISDAMRKLKELIGE